MRADTLYVNGTVWTGSAELPRTGALAARNGTIIALGDEAPRLRDGRTEVIDLDGGLLCPAFGDGHAHPILGGLERFGPAIGGLLDLEAILAAVGEYAAKHPEQEWIVGAGYQPLAAPGARFDARWLDRVVPDRQVVLRGNDYHSLWCNSRALALAGISADTPDPPIGRIVRRGESDRTPLGTLYEWHACDLVLRLVPKVPAARLRAAARDALRRYHTAGVHWVQDAWVDSDSGAIDAYLDVVGEGMTGVRVNLALRADPETWRQQRGEFAECRNAVAATGRGEAVTIRTVKFFADGIVKSRTASLLDPYEDMPDECGMPVWPAGELTEAVSAFDRDGFQVHIHAIGDAGVRAALDAIEHAIMHQPAWDRRPVITHVQLVHPTDIPRFAALGVIANVQPFWAQQSRDQNLLTRPRLGVDRTALQFPLRSLVRSGATVSFGSDWPVSTYQPIEGIRVAVNRQTPEGQPPQGWIPHERLTLDEALTAYTFGSAYQAFAERSRGALRVGNAAEVALLPADAWATLMDQRG